MEKAKNRLLRFLDFMTPVDKETLVTKTPHIISRNPLLVHNCLQGWLDRTGTELDTK